MSTDRLQRAVRQVVEADNCSGCGACATLSGSITLDLDRAGFLRPVVAPTDDASEAMRAARRFEDICPGVGLRAPRPPAGATRHPVFGVVLSAWEAHASDPTIRLAGSSGGVLTALQTWLLETGRVPHAIGAARAHGRSTRTVAVRITSKAEALAAAGSRYAPVGVAALVDGRGDPGVIVGKPCEISAVRRLDPAATTGPRLSFFCAGVPSQEATENLVRSLGVDPDEVTDLRYRGQGWPGDFIASDGQTVGRLSYDESWGAHLGRALQWRCKLCPDGTGEDADLSVGDFWRSDDRGYPVFTDGEGNSALIVRTPLGARLLADAVAAGVLAVSPLDPDLIAGVQPLQRDRRRTLVGRLAGRVLAHRRIPRFRGYGLLAGLLHHPRLNVRAARGTARRSGRR